VTGEVSPADGSGGQAARAELRASHADRDRVVEILRIAAGDGRLTAEELDQRLEVALVARTLGELTLLTTDLQAAGSAPGAAHARPKDLVTIECGSSKIRRDGQWTVPRRMDVRIASGSVRLDFTEAAITQPSLRVDAEVQSGSLTIVTRPGIVVDADAVSVANGSVRVKTEPGPSVPVILEIQVSGKVGSGHVRSGPPRPTLRQRVARRCGRR
jgi:Domain of unknown function (DUF1707)